VFLHDPRLESKQKRNIEKNKILNKREINKTGNDIFFFPPMSKSIINKILDNKNLASNKQQYRLPKINKYNDYDDGKLYFNIYIFQ
jgi:hypothetical protein